MILAGGRATRFPGKLTRSVGGRPMIARVLANVRALTDEIVVSTSALAASEMLAVVDVPLVVDGEEARGPVGGLVAAFATLRAARVFAVAGDAPFIDAAFLRRLSVHWRDGDEALVPIHDTVDGAPQSEPLAALYDRLAFLREGARVLRSGCGALRLVVEALATRYVHVDDPPRTFANVNTPGDYAAMLTTLADRGELP